MNPNYSFTLLPSKPKTRVLVVESHTSLRCFLANTIDRQAGFTCVGIAADGLEGLELARKTRPDIVLSALSFPKMDGFRMLREIRKMDPAVRCIVFSAHWDSCYIQQAIAEGVDSYIFKSKPEDLLKALGAVAAGGTYFPEELLTHTLFASMLADQARSSNRQRMPALSFA